MECNNTFLVFAAANPLMALALVGMTLAFTLLFLKGFAKFLKDTCP